MSTPANRRPIRRIPQVESSEDHNAPTIIKPIGTAEVTEQIGGKTVTYEAEVTKDESIPTIEEREDESEIFNAESFFSSNKEESDEPRKSSLARMFDQITNKIESDQIADSFYAYVIRLSDPLGQYFNNPFTGAQMDVGHFRFTSRDMFAFNKELQKINGNSGGTFNVIVYDLNGKPLTYIVNERTPYASVKQIGLSNHTVPNPKIESNTGDNGNPNNQQMDIMKYLADMQDRADARQRELILAMNQESEVEKRLKERMIDNLFSPKEENGFNANKFAEMIMTQGVVMNSLGDMFAKMANREPAPLPEPTMVDKFNQIMDIPMVQNFATKLLDVGEMIAVSKIAPNEIVETEEEETPIELSEKDKEMQTLISTLIDELESDRPLDNNNEVIIQLASDYPSQVELLKSTCQSLDFQNVLNMLFNITAKIQPSPFAPFIDLAESEKQKQAVFNQRGIKLLERLQVFYTFVREQADN